MTVWPVLVVVVEVWIVVIIVHVCALTLSLAFFSNRPPTPNTGSGARRPGCLFYGSPLHSLSL